MGASIDSSRPVIRESINSGTDPLQFLTDGLEEFDNALAKDEKLSVLPAVADEDGALRVLVDPKYLPRPQVPQAPVVPQASLPSKLDALYEPEFQRLELALQARHPHVPSSVTEGNVATLSLVTVLAGGEAVFESALEEHVAGPAK